MNYKCLEIYNLEPEISDFFLRLKYVYNLPEPDTASKENDFLLVEWKRYIVNPTPDVGLNIHLPTYKCSISTYMMHSLPDEVTNHTTNLWFTEDRKLISNALVSLLGS